MKILVTQNILCNCSYIDELLKPLYHGFICHSVLGTIQQQEYPKGHSSAENKKIKDYYVWVM